MPKGTSRDLHYRRRIDRPLVTGFGDFLHHGRSYPYSVDHRDHHGSRPSDSGSANLARTAKPTSKTELAHSVGRRPVVTAGYPPA